MASAFNTKKNNERKKNTRNDHSDVETKSSPVIEAPTRMHKKKFAVRKKRGVIAV